MTTKYTPTPLPQGTYSAEQNEDGSFSIWLHNNSGSGAEVCSGILDERFPPFIARVVNSHDALVKALEELCADKYLADPINADRMANARAALSLARGA